MTDHNIGLSEPIKHVIDALSIGAAVATFFSWLPDIAALLSVIWLILRIWESETVKGWTGRERP